VFILATRKRKAPAKSDRLIEGLISQFATSQKESTSMFIAAEERHYKLLADRRRGRHSETWPSGQKTGRKRGIMRRG